jgi:type II secretory pathway component PulF
VSQISTGSLIRLSQRVGTALRSGVDARRVWEMESRHASGSLRERLEAIRQRVASGDPVADAMRASGGYFPPMFVQMVEVGESTGKLDEVLLRLAEHYEHGRQMQRAFWFGIAWPLSQLIVAVFVIALVIWMTGVARSMTGDESVDILGWGLSGTSGAIIWLFGVSLVFGAIALTTIAVSRGWLGTKPVMLAMKIPVLGNCLESFALSRLTWSLAVALESGMDAVRAVEMAIRATQNPYFAASLPLVAGSVRANRQFHESFADGRVFPSDFLQQLESAETAGATTESLQRLAREYDGRARTAMKILTGIVTGIIWIGCFGIMIYFIITLARQYIGGIYDALEMTKPGKF